MTKPVQNRDSGTAPLSKKNANVKVLKHIANFNIFMDNCKAEFNKKWAKEITQGCSMEDFQFMKQIGSGAFGRVYTAKYLQSQETVAIKSLEKRYLVETGHVTHSKQEVKALNCVQFEFVINLLNFFMDNVYLYLVLPFIPGALLQHAYIPRKDFRPELFHNPRIPPAPQFYRQVQYVPPNAKPLPPKPRRYEPMDVDQSMRTQAVNYQNRPQYRAFPVKRMASQQVHPGNKQQRTYYTHNYNIEPDILAQKEHELDQADLLEYLSLEETVPFPPNLEEADETTGYEYDNNGEMFFHLATKRKFEENLSKFYAAQVVLALQYLHGVGLVYRDLKPENIMICSDGYLKLTDFGFCKKINGKRTYTMLGTPQYLAPEIVLSQGYGYAADWWAFGILIYEMSAGFPPFMGTDAAVMEKIPKGKYGFPVHFSASLKDLIQKLMVLKPSERFGVLKDGVNDIKLHDWFKDLDWDGVLYKRVKSPYKPTTEGPSYLSNFDLTVTGELRVSAENEFSNEFATFTV